MLDPQLASVVLNPDMEYLAHLSINSAAAVVQEIRKCEEDHWFAGLRQAELFIHEKRGALSHAYYQLRSQQRHHRQLFREVRSLLIPLLKAVDRSREIDFHLSVAARKHSGEVVLPQPEIQPQELSEQIDLWMTMNSSDRLQGLTVLGILSEDEYDRLEDLSDQIEQLERTVKESQVLVRDAQMELNAALGERDRITKTHAEEIEGTSFADLQERYAPVMLQQRQARYLAARIWAAQNGLPETVGAALFDTPIAQRDELMRREAAIRTQLDVPAAMCRASMLLASLEPEQQQAVLIQAAQFVIEGQSHGGTNQRVVDRGFYDRPQ